MEEGRALALALRGEMLAVANTFQRLKEISSDRLRDHADDAEDMEIRVYTKAACSIAIFSKSSDRFGLLDDPQLIADLAQFYPRLPVEDRFQDESVWHFRELYQGRVKAIDTAIKRATNLAEKLEAAADRLAPGP